MAALSDHRFADFQAFTDRHRSDFRDTGPVLAHLVGGAFDPVVHALALVDYAVSFMRLHLQADRIWPQVIWFDHAVFWPMVAFRYAALAACALWAFTHMVRKPDAAEPSAISV